VGIEDEVHADGWLLDVAEVVAMWYLYVDGIAAWY
jgi:hypothetical protein